MQKFRAGLFVAWLALVPVAASADSTINNLGAGAAVQGTDILPAYQGANPATGVTATQLKTFIGGGTVTSVATSCGVSGGPITGTGTVKATATPNAQVGTTYAILDADCGKVVTLSNAASIAVSIAQAGTAGSFASGWFATVINIGAGTVTITPTTSTIDGAATLTLTTNQSVDLFTDGTNYFTARGRVPGGLFTVTGALKGNGAGVVSQAACADISDASVFCNGTNAANLTGSVPVAQIGASAASHAVPVDVAGTSTYKVIPNCIDSAGNHINYTQSTDAFSCGTSSSGAGGGFVSTYVTGGTQFYAPLNGMITATGTAYTANTTAYCTFGTVTQNVTIKALAIRITTGIAASNVEFAIYSVSGGTLTLVDTSSAQVASVTSSTNPQTNLANTTDALTSGTLYAWCAASSGAIVVTSFAAGSTGAAAIIGSSSQTSAISNSIGIIGKSFPVTYSATPSSTFPGTISLSTGTDIVAGTATAPNMIFLVN